MLVDLRRWFYSFPRRDLVGGITVVVALAVGGYFWWERERPMPLDHLADAEAIAEKFNETVFGNEFSADDTHLFKWRGPYRLTIAAGAGEPLNGWIVGYLAELGRYAGIKLTHETRTDVANVKLFLVDRSQYRNVITLFDKNPTVTARRLEDHICFLHAKARNYIYFEKIIVIRKSLSATQARSCLLEELYQGLGPGKDSRKLRYSISASNGDNLTELSLNDKLILRALYDDRLAPGMPRVEAMKIARQVIAELHAAVRAQGPDALIHPRHKARTAAKTKPN